MPYVNVWVEDCDGGCDHNANSMDAINIALAAIRDGRADDAAQTLAAVSGCKVEMASRKKEAELSDLLRQWREIAGPRQDFLTFAHHRRKFSAA